MQPVEPRHTRRDHLLDLGYPEGRRAVEAGEAFTEQMATSQSRRRPGGGLVAQPTETLGQGRHRAPLSGHGGCQQLVLPNPQSSM